MGDSSNEEAANNNGFGGDAQRNGWFDSWIVCATAVPPPSQAAAARRRPLLCANDHANRLVIHAAVQPLWCPVRLTPGSLIGRRPTMKKLMILFVFAALLVGASGCHVCDCWNYAWNSRFHPEHVAPRQQPCRLVDQCDGPVVTEAAGCGCGCGCGGGGGGAPTIVPGPVPVTRPRGGGLRAVIAAASGRFAPPASIALPIRQEATPVADESCAANEWPAPSRRPESPPAASLYQFIARRPPGRCTADRDGH